MNDRSDRRDWCADFDDYLRRDTDRLLESGHLHLTPPLPEPGADCILDSDGTALDARLAALSAVRAPRTRAGSGGGGGSSGGSSIGILPPPAVAQHWRIPDINDPADDLALQFLLDDSVAADLALTWPPPPAASTGAGSSAPAAAPPPSARCDTARPAPAGARTRCTPPAAALVAVRGGSKGPQEQPVVVVVGVERVSRGGGARLFKAKLQHADFKRCGSKAASRSGIFEHELDAARAYDQFKRELALLQLTVLRAKVRPLELNFPDEGEARWEEVPAKRKKRKMACAHCGGACPVHDRGSGNKRFRLRGPAKADRAFPTAQEACAAWAQQRSSLAACGKN